MFSPLDHEDHPKFNDSPLCGRDDTSKFQSLIGACQWLISLCHFDIAQAIMSLSRFRHCPHQGHIDWLKSICGYIHKFPQGAIHFELEFLIMNPYSVKNWLSMIGWKLCMAHLKK